MLNQMSRILRLLPLAVAVVSAFTGAVAAVFPAMVVAFVTLFYNSAGGVLIFLGNLISLLPQPFSAAGSPSSLPAFPLLDMNTRAIVLWSVAASILCFIAALGPEPEQANRKERIGRRIRTQRTNQGIGVLRPMGRLS
jgi:hypothetical protein